MNDFLPKRGLRNGHAMTVYCWGKPRTFPALPAPSERYFDVERQARVLAHCHWQPDVGGHPALVALHGLEGSSAAHYMRGIAAKAYARGFNVILLNQRNCGGTEALSDGLYHSGLTADAAHVIAEIRHDGIDRVVVAGYSLGGNLALKLAGEYGDAAPASLKGVCAVSPVMELAECVRALERRENFIYQWNFVRGLKARMRRKAAAHPGRYAIDRLANIRTVRQFDEVLHRAALLVRRRRRLLLPGERHAGHRPDSRASARHLRRRRSVRPRRDLSRAPPAVQPPRHGHRHEARRPLRVRIRGS